MDHRATRPYDAERGRGRSTMPGDLVEQRLSESELRTLLTPKDHNLVLEAPRLPTAGIPTTGAPDGGDPLQDFLDGGPADLLEDRGQLAFTAVDGAYAHYERLVTWHRHGEHWQVNESLRFWPALGVFTPFYYGMVRRALLKGWRGVHPWWAMPDRLSPHQSRVIAAMGLFHVIGGMLTASLTNTLTFASDDLGTGSAGEQSAVFIAARLGAVLTILVMAMADRIGRRRVAIWTAGAAVALTTASALVPSLLALAALQTLSRNLAIAAMLSSDTISVEEIPAGSRAAVQGLGALSFGLGAGSVILLLPLADLGTGGWRLIFGAAILGAPLIALAARDLPESRRFLNQEVPRSTPGETAPKRKGVRLNRLLLLGSLLFLVNFFVAPSSQLQNDFLTTDRGFTGARISLFVVLTALPAFFGIVLGGRWADSRGRRGVLVIGLASMTVFGAAFFLLSGAGMWASATAYATLSALAVPALGVLAPELFPTARRGTARGLLSAVATAGAVAGLLIAGVLADQIGYGPAFALVALAPAVAMVLSFFVPETVGAELEDLNENATDPASP